MAASRESAQPANEDTYLTVGAPQVFTPAYRQGARLLRWLAFLQMLALLGLAACIGPWVFGVFLLVSLPVWGFRHLSAAQRFGQCQSWREELLETLPPSEYPCCFGRLELDERREGSRWRRRERADSGMLIFEPAALRFVGDSVRFRAPFSYVTYAARRPAGWLDEKLGVFGFYLMFLKPINGVHGVAFYSLEGDTVPQRRRTIMDVKERPKPLWTEAR